MGKGNKKSLITPREEDYSRWYNDVIQHAELADHSPVRGCMVIRPYGFAIWEHLRDALDRRFKDTGHQNAYFPLFIPKSFFEKEAKHVEGFAKESAIVTHHRLIEDGKGGLTPDPTSKLEEELVIRPTSETIIYNSYAKWVDSWRDLPVLINQWANVVRWELRTRPFLRTTEFLWQEGHTAHENEADAEEETRKMLGVYQDVMENVMAMPVIPGQKSEQEKFAGALRTYTVEAMMRDGKSLQAGTSHNLGQSFAKAFDLTFQDREGNLAHAWNTSWGVSTRLIGGLIMTHGDDKGLVLPPALAPIHVVIVPIWKTDEQKDLVVEAAEKMAADLEAIETPRSDHPLADRRGISVHLDLRDNLRPGAKYFEWERKGVPIRVELGPRDLEKNQVVCKRRDQDDKQFLDRDEFVSGTLGMLEEIQTSLIKDAKAFRDDRTEAFDDYDAFKAFIAKFEDKSQTGGFAHAHWCGSVDCENKVKDDTKATIRCIPFAEADDAGACISCGGDSPKRVIFAKAY